MSSSVGIAIARKRQQDGLFRDGLSQSGAGKNQNQTKEEFGMNDENDRHQQYFGSKGSYQKPVSSSQLFLSGSLLYGVCVLAPAAIGILLRKYEAALETARSHEGTETGWYYSWDDFSSLVMDVFCRLYHAVLIYLYLDDGPELLSFCSSSQLTQQDSERLFWSPDTAWTDLAVVAVLSLALATIRMAITRLVVPLEDPSRVEALVKSKSVHLLSRSRDYQLTPVSIRKQLSWSNNSLSGSSNDKIMMPDLYAQNDSVQPLRPQHAPQDEGSFADDESIGLRLDASESLPEPTTLTEANQKQEMKKPPETIPHPPPETDESAELDDADMEVLHVNAAAVDAAQMKDSTKSEPSQKSLGLHAGPRMASALFRICYSVVASFLALVYFRTSDFWPAYVLGRGSTQHCWDLGGSLSVGGMDGDFDHKNTVLRRYFLWQAAYHWHAGAFHIFSSIWLLLVRLQRSPENRENKEDTGNNQSWTFSYFSATHTRSLASHTLALVLLATSYVFSSLRRLGAIGMFAFDFSSIFLHLLQVCVNSSDDSPWHGSRRIRFIRNVLVLPSFVFCRFFIWPALWWSAVTESTSWLKQLEMTLFPGAAWWLKCVWHASMGSFMILNIVYLHRLLNQEHIRRILRTTK